MVIKVKAARQGLYEVVLHGRHVASIRNSSGKWFAYAVRPICGGQVERRGPVIDVTHDLHYPERLDARLAEII